MSRWQRTPTSAARRTKPSSRSPTPTEEDKTLTTNFIAGGVPTAPTVKRASSFPETTIPGQLDSRSSADLIPEGSTGLLEITGDPELLIRATLVRERGSAPGAEVPVVNVGQRGAGSLTDVYLKGIRKDGSAHDRPRYRQPEQRVDQLPHRRRDGCRRRAHQHASRSRVPAAVDALHLRLPRLDQQPERSGRQRHRALLRRELSRSPRF